jgi:hypothetical protein
VKRRDGSAEAKQFSQQELRNSRDVVERRILFWNSGINIECGRRLALPGLRQLRRNGRLDEDRPDDTGAGS